MLNIPSTRTLRAEELPYICHRSPAPALHNGDTSGFGVRNDKAQPASRCSVRACVRACGLLPHPPIDPYIHRSIPPLSQTASTLHRSVDLSPPFPLLPFSSASSSHLFCLVESVSPLLKIFSGLVSEGFGFMWGVFSSGAKKGGLRVVLSSSPPPPTPPLFFFYENKKKTVWCCLVCYQVTYGEDNLIRPKSASFTDLLLKGGNGEDDE